MSMQAQPRAEGRIALASGCPKRLNRIGRALSRRGHRIHGYVKSADLLSSQAEFELLVISDDLESPGSLETITQVSRAPGREGLEVIYLGRDSESDLLRAYAAGASDCLLRDCELGELVAKCRRLLARRPAPTPQREQPPAKGSRLAERYTVQRLLGSGSYGSVYVAWDEARREKVALKLLAESARGAEARERFLRESYTLAAVDHPHVVSVLDVGRCAGERPFCALELVAGEPLDRVVAERGPCTAEEVGALLEGLCGALRALREAGIVHRDIKPANVVLRGSRPSDPVLIDFGLAKLPLDHAVTPAGVMLGSPGYMAPEVLEREPDHRSDLFSLGQVVAYAARGRVAFSDLHGLQLLNHMSRRPAPLPAELPSGLAAIVRRLTAVPPADRFPDAERLQLALRSPETQEVQ